METMLERVARGIRQWAPGDVHLTEDNLLNMARGAVAAMREPTEAVIDLAESRSDEPHTLESAFRAVTGAILAEASSGSP